MSFLMQPGSKEAYLSRSGLRQTVRTQGLTNKLTESICFEKNDVITGTMFLACALAAEQHLRHRQLVLLLQQVQQLRCLPQERELISLHRLVAI